MKKILFFLSVAGMFTLTGCNNDDDRPDNDTIGEVFEINVDFLPGSYSIVAPLDPPIYSTDVVLVYRQTGLSGGKPVWRLVPQTFYFPDGGELEYVSDFSENDYSIYIDSNMDLTQLPQYTLNQTFRIAILPADYAAGVDTENFDAVMSAMNAQGGDAKIRLVE